MPDPKKPKIPPEIILADWIFAKIPRGGFVYEASLNHGANWDLWNPYSEVSIQLLEKEGLVKITRSKGFYNPYDTKWSHSDLGREVYDQGGYLQYYKANKEEKALSKKVASAEGRNKIFTDRVKIAVLILTVIGCVVTVLKYRLDYQDALNKVKAKQEDKTQENQNGHAKPDSLQGKSPVASHIHIVNGTTNTHLP